VVLPSLLPIHHARSRPWRQFDSIHGYSGPAKLTLCYLSLFSKMATIGKAMREPYKHFGLLQGCQVPSHSSRLPVPRQYTCSKGSDPMDPEIILGQHWQPEMANHMLHVQVSCISIASALASALCGSMTIRPCWASAAASCTPSHVSEPSPRLDYPVSSSGPPTRVVTVNLLKSNQFLQVAFLWLSRLSNSRKSHKPP
jgi:hypothetical protein